MKKGTRLFLIVGCAFSLLFASPSLAAKLKIGYSDWPGWVAWEVGIQKGWFKKAGVDVEFIWFEYVPSMDAFAASKVDAVCMTNGDALVTGATGKACKGILINDYSNGNDMVVGRPGIRKITELKGKKVGVELGFVSHLLLLKGLEAKCIVDAGYLKKSTPISKRHTRVFMPFYDTHAPNYRKHQRDLPDISHLNGWLAQDAEAELPDTQYRNEIARSLEFGLPGSDSIADPDISCFQRGELPHWSGINTFLKLPYLEDVRQVGDYDVAFVGAPFDIGTTYRSGTRFGPQGMRRISSLYTPYNFELGIDLRESLKMCDIGDIFCPANITKGHDQITKGVAHILSSGTLPMIMGGDHSIGYPCVRGVAECVEGKVGIIHLDRHVDTQEKDMDEIMHTCP